jgi:uncharacterized repeat protein (TIGR03803 family)
MEKILYAFNAGTTKDGCAPAAALTNVNGVLFGTTQSGGANGAGTIFSITTAGVEKIVHSFSPSTEGGTPMAGLVVVNGKLYGTTSVGGSAKGGKPLGGVINVNGTFYGTTETGGAHALGTVYSVTTSRVEKVSTALKRIRMAAFQPAI